MSIYTIHGNMIFEWQGKPIEELMPGEAKDALRWIWDPRRIGNSIESEAMIVLRRISGMSPKEYCTFVKNVIQEGDPKVAA